MLCKERSAAISEMLGMWRRRTSFMDVSQEDGTPGKGKSTAEKVKVLEMWRREPCYKRL